MRLAPNDFAVLALVAEAGPSTAYAIRRQAQKQLWSFWPMGHTVIYSQCERLAAEGLLSASQEAAGRHRRIYSLTTRGHRVLDDSVAGGRMPEPPQLKDAVLLRLYFGASEPEIARTRAVEHQRRARELRQMASQHGEDRRRRRDLLERLADAEKSWAEFWSSQA